MKLSEAQRVLDMFADDILQTGGKPEDADVEIHAQDGQLLRVEVEWEGKNGTKYTARWHNR